MRSQQEAGRAEQQRIKNLVLNYDLEDAGETGPGGEIDLPTTTHHHMQNQSSRRDPRDTKNKYQARRLQLSDVDWT